MIEANFYELSKTAWTKAFPKLIETAYSKGSNVLVYCELSEEVAAFDNLLWTYEQLSFLPHVTDQDPHQEETPIIISTSSVAKNAANTIALGSLKLPDDFTNFSKILVMYQKDDIEQTERVKALEIKLCSTECKINKFTQSPAGTWQRPEALA